MRLQKVISSCTVQRLLVNRSSSLGKSLVAPTPRSHLRSSTSAALPTTTTTRLWFSTSGTPLYQTQGKLASTTSRIGTSGSDRRSRSFSSVAAELSPEDDNEREMSDFPAFADLPGLHETLANNLRKMKLSTMTEIQAKTWEPASQGQDVLGRARTGTGKTISFLLPALQQLLHQEDLSRNDIHMLVLSPTRELAAQIDDQAQALTKSKSKQIGHQVVFGGSSRPKDVSAFERRVPTILVATPGRLRDHLDNTMVRGKPFRNLLRKTSILVLDETDRLLDMGFQKEVNEIIEYLPSKSKRQTLLFSATVPAQVKAVMAATMKPNFVTVDCIHDKDPASHTNQQVEQRHVIVPYKSRLVSGTVELIWETIQRAKDNQEPLKVVVFFNTANLVAFYAALFQKVFNMDVLELHSRKSQSYRTRTADKFRAADEAILFTSDVSARGVDYPGVTNVIQVGIADSRESYIHRLGRTGRAGKEGHGLLILYDVERNFLGKLNGIDVPVDKSFQSHINGQPKPDTMDKLNKMLDKIRDGRDSGMSSNLDSAYRSMLGFYNGKLSKQLGVKDPAVLIDFVNEFAQQGGCSELPGIEKQTLGKMGLRYTTGLNITANMARGGGGGRRNNDGNNRNGDRNTNSETRGGRGGGRRNYGTIRNGDRSSNDDSPKRRNADSSTPEPKKFKTNRDSGGGRGRDKKGQHVKSNKAPVSGW